MMTKPNDAPDTATGISSLSNPTTTIEPVSEPVSEPVIAEEDVQLSLKVRTLDQKTYSITICAAASVPQLKELVAIETGITLSRQRLIYRGRVLKNDQTLASYSLENGHVLHLVVRAVPSPPPSLTDMAAVDDRGSAAAPDLDHTIDLVRRDPSSHEYTALHLDTTNDMDALNTRLDEFQRSSLRSRLRSRQLHRRTHSPPPPPRDNDEPDPTMGQLGAVQPGRVLMGATIAVPGGTDVTMPFLSSLVANLVTQVSESDVGVEAGEAMTGETMTGQSTDRQRRMTLTRDGPGGTTAAGMDSATARALRHHHRNRDGTGRQRTARHSSSSVERQTALRARTGLRLEAVRATLDDASLEFPTELTALPQGDNNTAMSELQQQVEMLLTLLARFEPRLRLLPAALAQRDRSSAQTTAASAVSNPVIALALNGSSTASPDIIATPPGVISASIGSSRASNAASIGSSRALSGSSAAPVGPNAASMDTTTVPVGPNSAPAGSDTTAAELVAAPVGPNITQVESNSGSVFTSNSAAAAGATLSGRQIMCTIEALQTLGETTELLARMARHAFVRQSMRLDEPISRRGEAAMAGDRMQARFHATQAGARVGTAARGRTQATFDATQATRAARIAAPGVSNMRPRTRVGRISVIDSLDERNSAVSRTDEAASSPAELPGLTLNLPMGLSGGAVPPVPGSATFARSIQSTSRAETAPSGGNAPLSPSGAQISISGMGLPLVSSVVFPFSLAAGLGGSHATTTWNLADFISRLICELPISTLYGVMAGDATHLHHMLAHMGFALFSGVDVPRVTRPSILAWSQDLVGELRRLLHSNTLPADVMDEVYGTVERRLALRDELLAIVEPFIPDLVDFLVRATSASRAAAFGTSSATSLRRMARQIVCGLRCYARGDSLESEDESDERVKRLLRKLLVWLGMNNHMATFVVDSLWCWTERDNDINRRGQIRERDEASDDASVADSPATKRQRE